MKGTDGPEFPRTPADVTDKFLSDVFDTTVAITRATPLGKDRGMLGQLVLLEVDGAPVDRIVAKLHAPRPETLNSARRGGTHLREVNFMREVAPRTAVRVPDCYGAWFEPATAEFLLLMEAIDADTTVDQIDGLALTQVEMVIDQAAALHAAWYDSAEISALGWVPRPDAPTRRDNLHALLTGGWEQLCVLMDDPSLGPVDQSAMHDRLDAMLADLNALPPTLLHGDLRADNLLFTGSEVVLIDWQGLGLGPPGWDLAYLISQCLTIDDRRAHESRLLDRYQQKASAFGLDLARSELRAGYEPGLFFGLIVAAAICVVGDPNERRSARLAHAMGTRSIAALRDLGCM